MVKRIGFLDRLVGVQGGSIQLLKERASNCDIQNTRAEQRNGAVAGPPRPRRLGSGGMSQPPAQAASVVDRAARRHGRWAEVSAPSRDGGGGTGARVNSLIEDRDRAGQET